jgi:pilus assembly protein CpaB
MNRRLVTILISAFVIAGICAIVVGRMVGSRLNAVAKPVSTRVVAAAADVKLGAILTDHDLTTVEIAGTAPKGSIVDKKTVIGRGVISNLYEGEPILESRLAAPGSGGGLAATIPDGMRACAVKVDEVVGVAGFVTPGEHVDVLISGLPPGMTQDVAGQKVKTLLQNIGVLSAGTDIQKDLQGKPQPVQVVNLLVTPDQAEILSLASSQTHIQLVLRNPLDSQITQTSGTVVSNLFADKAGAPVKVERVAVRAPKPAAPKPFSIQIYNGSKRTDQKFASQEVIQ